jgi:hypothetical protein
MDEATAFQEWIKTSGFRLSKEYYEGVKQFWLQYVLFFYKKIGLFEPKQIYSRNYYGRAKV